ncbi:N-methylproline demethylase, partial [Methylobacterium tarhaniae]
ERYQLYHLEKAKGGIGLSMFGGSSNVAPDSPNIFRQLNVGTDEIIPWLQQFSARMHEEGAALMVQITHLGRRGEPYGDQWLPTIGPSAIRETLHRSFPKEMDEHDIRRVVKAYAAAVRRCRDGGLDGVETLAGGHLIGQFLSPATNRRTDRYGGSLENRCRFGLEVFEAIRREVGDDLRVGMR